MSHNFAHLHLKLKNDDVGADDHISEDLAFRQALKYLVDLTVNKGF